VSVGNTGRQGRPLSKTEFAADILCELREVFIVVYTVTSTVVCTGAILLRMQEKLYGSIHIPYDMHRKAPCSMHIRPQREAKWAFGVQLGG
jgi:hypothetical protein